MIILLNLRQLSSTNIVSFISLKFKWNLNYLLSDAGDVDYKLFTNDFFFVFF